VGPLSILLAALVLAPPAPPERPTAVRVSFVTDEADGVLAILAKRRAGRKVTESDWRRIFSSDGYRRLERRETGMGRSFEEKDFRRFVESRELLLRREALAAALSSWKRADAPAAARRALAYLAPGASIRATIYPVIKPRENSFVSDLETNPAIFLAVDPAISRAKLENTLAHELHHVGYAQSCRNDVPPGSETVVAARKWLSAFGEGVAMLAAAGGPDVHPHAVNPAAERARWDRDFARVDDDFRSLVSFFDDVASGRLSGPDADARGMSFFGVQGPWYTVGYAMAVTVEKAFGRADLVERLCDPPKFLEAYNRAAESESQKGGPTRPMWPEALLEELGSASPPPAVTPVVRRNGGRNRGDGTD
jgi:hypothetical protein